MGNAALGGAVMMLLNSDMTEKAKNLAQNAQTLDLSKNKGFSEKFMMGMMLEEV